MNTKTALSALVNTIRKSEAALNERSADANGGRHPEADERETIHLDRMEAALRQMLRSAEVRENELRDRVAVYSSGVFAKRDLQAEVEDREKAVLRAEKMLDLRERLLKESEALQFNRKKAMLEGTTDLRDMKDYLELRSGTRLRNRRIPQ